MDIKRDGVSDCDHDSKIDSVTDQSRRRQEPSTKRFDEGNKPTTTHKKLERVRGSTATISQPRVTFSDHTDVIGGHKKLERQKNILTADSRQKSILVEKPKISEAANTVLDPPIKDKNADNEGDIDEYYKTVKCMEDDYSYAYR